MTTTAEYLADIRRFTALVPKRIDAIHKEATQRVMRTANTPRDKGGKMPVITGTLRGSLIGGPTQGTLGEGENAVVLAIAGAQPLVEMFYGWTAPYADPVEFGRAGTRANGAGFARGAAETWVATVEAVALEVSRV